MLKNRKKPTLWITDSWTTLDHPKDSTLRLIEEGVKLDLPQAWCDVKSIRLQEGAVVLDARKLRAVDSSRNSGAFHMDTAQTCRIEEFLQIHYRTDPPVDLAFIHPLQLLQLGTRLAPSSRRPPEFVNPLSVLLTRCEKLECASLPQFFPTSLVSSDWAQLQAFGKNLRRTVLKPLHEAQSHGVELLDWKTEEGRTHAKAQLSKITQKWSQPALLQTYLDGIQGGETRLWFLDGKLLGHFRKFPTQGSFRVNIDGGSATRAAELTAQEKSRVKPIGNHLKKLKIRLAAVDLIEGYITDFNFTSPGLITQMEEVLNQNFARTILKSLQNSW